MLKRLGVVGMRYQSNLASRNANCLNSTLVTRAALRQMVKEW